MKETIGFQTDDIESGTETENLIANTPNRMSNRDAENSPSVSVTSDKAARQIRSLFDSLM